jgi:hypothetical protein
MSASTEQAKRVDSGINRLIATCRDKLDSIADLAEFCRKNLDDHADDMCLLVQKNFKSYFCFKYFERCDHVFNVT